MKGLIAPTDYDWFRTLSNLRDLEEVNFWQPAGFRPISTISAGDPFFFKLKAPHNAVGGFGVFVRSCPSSASLAWEAFEERNGVHSYEELLQRCIKYRRHLKKSPLDEGQDPEIGCIMLVQPVFFEEHLWIPQPTDWKPTTISPTTYDLSAGEGARIWSECMRRGVGFQDIEDVFPRRGPPRLIEPRLGQGSFRLSVVDAYDRACSISGEHSLPALEAAHIKPFSKGGEHSVRNGLLFRADIHKLFDAGYVTVTPAGEFRVSPRLKRDWSNGKSYYPLDGRPIAQPKAYRERPDPTLLKWHNEHIFRSTGS